MGENTNGNNETNTENQSGNNTENNNSAGNNTENTNSTNTENNTSQGQNNTADTNSVKEQAAQIAAQARTEVFKLLGIDEKDTQTIRAIKAFMDTQKNENNSGNNTVNNEAEKRAIEAETKVDLMKNGVQPQFVDDAVIIVMAKTQGKKDADIKNVVSELKNKYPNWFEAKDDENNAGKKGTGNIYNPAKNKEKGSGSLGQRLAAQRKGNKPAKSFWS